MNQTTKDPAYIDMNQTTKDPAYINMKKCFKQMIEYDKKLASIVSPEFSLKNAEYIDDFYKILDNTYFYKNWKNMKNCLIQIKSKGINKLIDEIANNLDMIEKKLLCDYLSFFLFKQIFSTTSLEYKNLNDPNIQPNIKLKNNDDYINSSIIVFNNFVKIINIAYNKNIEIDNKKIREIFHFLIEKAEKEGIFKYNKINKNVEGKLKTKKILIIDNFNDILTNDTIEISNIPYKIHKLNNGLQYLYSNHYSTISDIFRENKHSGHVFIMFYETILDSLCKMWFYIDIDWYGSIFLDIAKKQNINIGTLEKDYQNLLKDLNKFIKENDLVGISKISSEISKYHDLIKMKKIIKHFNKFTDNIIYLPFMFDFRGRLYFLSDCSPTFHKNIRYCLHNGPYLELKEHFHENIGMVTNVLDKHLNVFKEFENGVFLNRSNLEKRTILWMLITIAETEKSSLGKSVKIEKFISKGIEIYERTENLNMDLDKYIKIKYTKKIIEEFKQKKYVRRLIFKDATASCFQHIIKVLGGANEKSLTWCNFSSEDEWYDTYKYIILLFLETIDSKVFTKDELNSIFSRDSLKKTVMTEIYGASKKTCWKYFKLAIDLRKYSKPQLAEIRKIYAKFWDFLHESNALSLHSSTKITDSVTSSTKVELYDDSSYNSIYYNKEIKQKEYSMDGKRITYKSSYLTNITNDEKIFTSARANYIQSMDASMVRWILNIISIIVIHDSFGIDILNVSYLICLINQGMRIQFNKKTFHNQDHFKKLWSIFIVL